ncbi:hypothetical protein [Kitasatospora kifunensis]|uniref:Uncharacterized protein n=1 Tax=Kitasatospora kifunensis TaxID=58351 RepID=A0A7W7VTW6_KITKI|nr:hypothetical protein [Kitasatospora kifunensis]MBB4922213.1 hypothetical protein [Kitasatospora kifunensis]
MRKIVSNEISHNGGVARIEMDQAERFFVVCSGCRTEEYAAGMAPALGKLVEHTEG